MQLLLSVKPLRGGLGIRITLQIHSVTSKLERKSAEKHVCPYGHNFLNQQAFMVLVSVFDNLTGSSKYSRVICFLFLSLLLSSNLQN